MEKLSLPDTKVTHSGSFAATLRQPFPNRVTYEGSLNSTGNTPSGPWIGAAKFAGAGESFLSFGWTLTPPNFSGSESMKESTSTD